MPNARRAPKKILRKMQPHSEQGSRPHVCRRLFADDVDSSDTVNEGERDNMLNQINEQINRDLDEACKKYNFDFRSEVPLEGNWVWEPVINHPSERRDNQERAETTPASSEPPKDATDPIKSDEVVDVPEDSEKTPDDV